MVEWIMVKNKTFIFFICVLLIVFFILALFLAHNYRNSKVKKDLFSAIEKSDMPTIKRILDKYPTLIDAKQYNSDILSIFTEKSNPTPLLEAIRLNNIDLIKYLVENGVNVNKSNGTHTIYPIIEILNRGFGEISEYRYELAWLLIENGADLTVQQQYETVPYSIVGVKISTYEDKFQQQSLDLMKYVIEQKVSLKAPDPTNSQSGNTEHYARYKINEIIGMAARNNYVSVVEYFLEKGLYDVNDVVSLDGTTSLIQAVQGDSYEVCELLIEQGADITVIDQNGKTAYDYAMENGNQKIIDLLK